MNTSVSQSWSQPEQHLDPMAQMSNADLDDLGNLFEFGDIDLNNIPDVVQQQFGDHMQQPGQNLSHPNTPFQDVSPVAPPPGTSTQDFGGHEQFRIQHNAEQQLPYMSQPASQVPTSHPYGTESMYPQAMQQPAYHHPHLQQYQYPTQGYPPGHHVPPTPNSFEMHGEAGRFLQQQLDPQQRAILEQRYGLRKDDAIAFTPMVSPAGTPQYNVQPEFTIPGAYFSPLTSPMLHAQNGQQHQQHQQGYYTNPSTAPSSNATSPIDPNVDVDMMGDGMTLPESATSQPKRPRRKVATPRSVASRVRQSPIQKPQKRKSNLMLSSVAPSKDMDAIMAEAQKSGKPQPGSAGLQMPSVFNGSSEDGSISPEPLSEALMGPPPRPGSSVNQSPALSAQQQHDAKAAAGAAATPKSLLSRDGNQQPINGTAQADRSANESSSLEDLQLPEAASQQAPNRPPLSQINTQIASDSTPRMSARKTPKLGPLSTPASARPGSAMASPSAVASPVSATTPGALLKDKKQDSKGGRGNKKRGSVGAGGSNLASPALRPRISPSIKPLLPEGSATLHSSTHALLLASKSNYQNLLEGNHLPGVNYPDSLSTGLTSKRTSHKVAEQGRRNRINEALKEMQALLPKEYLTGRMKNNSNSEDSPEANGGIEDTKESKEDATAKSNSSKAATVESANVYIKNTQRKQMEIEAENDLLRRKLEEMERRYTEQNGVADSTEKASSVIDSASPASVKVQ